MQLKTLGKSILGAAGALALMAGAAQAYPDKPVELTVPYGAGGATDIVSRLFASHVSSKGYVSQPLTVVNRTGAGGVTGSAFAHSAKPDGYTILMARIGSHSVSPAMKESIPYKYDDFTHMSVIELNPFICAVNPNSAYNTFDDLIAAVKASPGTITYSSSGVGSALHIAGVFALEAAGVEDARRAAIHVPFDGGGNAAAAVVTGNIGYICTNSSALAGHIGSGALRPLLITIASSSFPDIPTAEALGYPALASMVGWSAISGPPGLPQNVQDYWLGVVDKLKGDQEWIATMEKQGSVPAFMSPAESKTFIDDQYTLYFDLVTKLELRIK
jgi:tripartite-type tricarboxylate transporter receptor subunit TctC